MGSHELAGFEAVFSTDPCEDFAAFVENADPVGEFGYIDSATFIEVDIAWSAQPCPLLNILTFDGEDLDPVVLPVSDVDFIVVDPDTVGEVELAWVCSRFTPAIDELTIGGEAVDQAVAVAVADVEVAIGSFGDVGGLIERLSINRYVLGA
jgi:hypothetical protein